MIVVNHILSIACIVLLIYLVHGAWFRDFGKKHYEMVRKNFFDLPFTKKWLLGWAISYTILVTFSLFSLVFIYVYFIVLDN